MVVLLNTSEKIKDNGKDNYVLSFHYRYKNVIINIIIIKITKFKIGFNDNCILHNFV